MPYKRIGLAALLLLVAIYLKLCMPSFAREAVPAIKAVLDEQQAFILFSEPWAESLDPG